MKTPSLQEQNMIEHCFGCGTKNTHGLHIETHWQGEETVSVWQPKPYYSSGNTEIMYGGIIASLIDCHSINTAISNAYKLENRQPGTEPLVNYVTAQLNVSYHKPVPINKTLTVKAKVLSSEGRKTWVESTITCDDQICAKGKVLAIRVD